LSSPSSSSSRVNILFDLLQVRAAAVFALGTFIANTGDRSDHANQIDFGVAMTLTQLAQDGSPLVRKVKH